MRTLRIVQTESSMELGGQEFATLALTEGLRRRGHDVRLVVRPRSRLAEIARQRAMPYCTLAMGKPVYPLAIARLGALLFRQRIEILHTHGSRDSWIGGLAARLSFPRPRMVLTRHKTTPISKNCVNDVLYHSLADAIVTTGGETTRTDLVAAHGFADGKVVSIPTGADIEHFHPRVDGGPFRKELGVGADECLVGTVCFLRRYKGLEYFVDAASRILRQAPRCRFVIVGDGPDRERLALRIREQGMAPRMTLVGHRTDVPGAMAALDVFVVASTSGETMTQTIPQALAMEIPVVATRVGGIADIVRHGETGLLVPPRDVEALARQILAMMDNRPAARAMAQRGRALVVESVSAQNAVTKNEQLYRSLLAAV